MNAVVTSEGFAIAESGLLDLFQVWRLNRACFPKDAYDLITLFNMTIMPGVSRLKAVADGKIVGYVAGEINKRENAGWIITIGVHPKFAGHGIGTATSVPFSSTNDAVTNGSTPIAATITTAKMGW